MYIYIRRLRICHRVYTTLCIRWGGVDLCLTGTYSLVTLNRVEKWGACIVVINNNLVFEINILQFYVYDMK